MSLFLHHFVKKTYLGKVTKAFMNLLPVPELQLKDHPGGNFTPPDTVGGLKTNRMARSPILNSMFLYNAFL